MAYRNKRIVDKWTVGVFVFAGIWFAALATLMVRDYRNEPIRRMARVALSISPAQSRWLPGDQAPLSDTQRRLEVAADRLGWPIIYTINPSLIEPNELGVTKWLERAVFIRSTMSPTNRTLTLAHELGHVMQPWALREDTAAEEIFAETVAYLVVRSEHDDIWPHARYVSQFKSRLNVLDLYRQEIEFAVQFLRGENTEIN